MFVLKVRRWVVWWFCLGVICGGAALVNIFFRELTRVQDRVILFVGVVFWLLGGLVCWAWEGIQLQSTDAAGKPVPEVLNKPEHQLPSELVAYDSRQALSRRMVHRPEMVGAYLRRLWEQEKKHHG